MAVRKMFICVSLIAFAIASQPAFAENGNDPSATPAQRPHRHHSGKHRRQQKQQQQQQQAPQTDGTY